MKSSDALPCTACGGSTIVTNSRPGISGINRRRECATCGQRFSTVETYANFLDDGRRLKTVLAKREWARH